MRKTVKRRRHENKTDYSKRIKLLKSGKPRVVVRISNKYVNVQFVKSENAQDKVELDLNSRKLVEYGWPEEFKNSLKSIPAAYLLGYLMGKKIIKEKKETPVLDFGMQRRIRKNRLYSFLKGIMDAGVDIKSKRDDVFPEEERINGKELNNQNAKNKMEGNIEKIKSEIDKKETK